MALVLPTPQNPAAILEKESLELKALKTSFPLGKTVMLSNLLNSKVSKSHFYKLDWGSDGVKC